VRADIATWAALEFLRVPAVPNPAVGTCSMGASPPPASLLEAALARQQATAFGKDAYPHLDAKAAALLHSVARNHALTDGSKRLASPPSSPSTASMAAASPSPATRPTTW
jgi:Fic/DOC family